MGKALVYVLTAGIAVCTLCMGVANATVLNFDDLETPGSDYTFMSSYSNSGFLLTSSVPSSQGFASPQQSNSYYFGSANLLNNYVDASTILTSSGGAFSIDKMDVHALYTGGSPLDFYAYLGSTQVGYLNYVISDYTWHTVNFDSSFQNITSLKWQQASNFHSFDNLVLNENSVVPEPATMALFVIGTAAMALIRRKKQIV